MGGSMGEGASHLSAFLTSHCHSKNVSKPGQPKKKKKSQNTSIFGKFSLGIFLCGLAEGGGPDPPPHPMDHLCWRGEVAEQLDLLGSTGSPTDWCLQTTKADPVHAFITKSIPNPQLSGKMMESRMPGNHPIFPAIFSQHSPRTLFIYIWGYEILKRRGQSLGIFFECKTQKATRKPLFEVLRCLLPKKKPSV